MRRELDDLALWEKPPQLREEFVGNVYERRTNSVRVFQRDSLPLRQVTRFPSAECRLNRLLGQTDFAADGGVDVDSEGTSVTDRYADSNQLDQASADGPPSRAEDHVGEK